MSVKISGALIDGAGIPMSGCQIILKARVNTSEVVMRTIATITTDGNGEYSFDAQVGRYCVYLRHGWSNEYCVGDITVYGDSKPGTLNDFLIALDEGDLKPDVVKRFEELVVQAQQSADIATENAQQVSQSVQEAARAKDDAKRYANDAQASAIAAAESQNAAAESEKQAEVAATQILATSLKIDKNLSEIADAGTDAQQQAREHLGLGAAATLDIQPDVYNRTAGVAALGMFGYGHTFTNQTTTRFNTGDEFLDWTRNAYPGRYVVYANTGVVIPKVLFSGLVEVIWPESTSSQSPRHRTKIILFYGINGDLYYNRYWTASTGYLIGWEKLKVKSSDFTGALRSTTNAWGSPDIGGLIWAAYQGDTDNDDHRQLFRGKIIPGSRLGMISVSAECNASGSRLSSAQFLVMSCKTYPQSGTFVALSGSDQVTLNKTYAFIGLFIRIA